MNTSIKIIKTCISVLLFGVLGVSLCQTKAGNYLEEDIGLDWLLNLRGPLPPPTDVIIVSIDHSSAEILHLPEEPERWSRTFYVSLIEKLKQQKPALIAFNIHFAESRKPENDIALAKAMAESKNVILGALVKRPTINDNEPEFEGQDFRLIKPVPVLSEAALDIAPFLLPKSSSTVKEYWTRFGLDNPTFPVSIFQHFVIKEAYPEVKQLLSDIDQAAFAKLPVAFEQSAFASEDLFRDIQSALAVSPKQLQQHIKETHYSAKVKRLLQSWLQLSGDKERLYLNHYGDVGAITTVPFYQVLAANAPNPDLFKDKIILVGYADNLEPDKQQGLYSAFSRLTGNVVSSTEIAATAVANLLDQSWLKPLPARIQALLILVWGIVLSVIFRLFSFKSAIVLTLTLTMAYVLLSLQLLKAEAIWLPLAIPLLQTALIVLWQCADYFIKLRVVSERYLPKAVFAINTRYPDDMDYYGILVQGVCMATDAGQYTALSETINPLQINKIMNDYYGAIFPKVKNRRGLISDVIGDAMLAVWAAEKAVIELRRQACHAALEIKSAVDDFNRSSQYQLTTRIGLHYGEMRLGNIGAKEHYEYRAVGDTVNTATRIEGLNKLLATRILVSAPVVTGLSDFYCRELGTFLLRGKTNPVAIQELMGYAVEIEASQQHLAEWFAKALAFYEGYQWKSALAEFRAIKKVYPDDGPTRFYVTYLQKRLALSVERTNDVNYSTDFMNFSKDHAAIIDVGNITSLLH